MKATVQLLTKLEDDNETIKFYARKISLDTDVQIVEYHHNQKNLLLTERLKYQSG